MKIVALCASLRGDSLNRKLLSLAVSEAKESGAAIESIDLRAFPLPAYDGDLEASSQGIPSKVYELNEKIVDSQGIIVASPEYNYSIPGHFKYTFDWLSRLKPVPFSKKAVLLMGASPSLIGAQRCLWSLRVPFEAVGAFVHPDMYSLPNADTAFDSEGRLSDPERIKRLKSNVSAFLEFAGKLSSV